MWTASWLKLRHVPRRHGRLRLDEIDLTESSVFLMSGTDLLTTAMKRRLYILLLVVLLVAICSGVRCILDERREPLFTFDEHLANFISSFSFGLMVAAVGLLVSLATKKA